MRTAWLWAVLAFLSVTVWVGPLEALQEPETVVPVQKTSATETTVQSPTDELTIPDQDVWELASKELLQSSPAACREGLRASLRVRLSAPDSPPEATVSLALADNSEAWESYLNPPVFLAAWQTEGGEDDGDVKILGRAFSPPKGEPSFISRLPRLGELTVLRTGEGNGIGHPVLAFGPPEDTAPEAFPFLLAWVEPSTEDVDTVLARHLEVRDLSIVGAATSRVYPVSDPATSPTVAFDAASDHWVLLWVQGEDDPTGPFYLEGVLFDSRRPVGTRFEIPPVDDEEDEEAEGEELECEPEMSSVFPTLLADRNGLEVVTQRAAFDEVTVASPAHLKAYGFTVHRVQDDSEWITQADVVTETAVLGPRWGLFPPGVAHSGDSSLYTWSEHRADGTGKAWARLVPCPAPDSNCETQLLEPFVVSEEETEQAGRVTVVGHPDGSYLVVWEEGGGPDQDPDLWYRRLRPASETEVKFLGPPCPLGHGKLHPEGHSVICHDGGWCAVAYDWDRDGCTGTQSDSDVFAALLYFQREESAGE